jgi:hypothetical protein
VAKAPAFQFYPGDYRKDPQLRMASWATRGQWMEMLCAMWDAPERGVLRGTVDQLCRLIGCTTGEMGSFLEEAEQLRFADVAFLPADDACHGPSQKTHAGCHAIVTVTNRRMVRDEKRRQDDARRQARHRRKSDITPESQAESQQSHIASSSSSSSSDQKHVVKTKKSETYSPEFEDAWSLFPARPGNSKKKAFAAWQSQIGQGVDPTAMIEGTRRYATYVRHEGNEGTNYVKLGATFFADKDFWGDDWKIAAPKSPSPDGRGRPGGEVIPFNDLVRRQEIRS